MGAYRNHAEEVAEAVRTLNAPVVFRHRPYKSHRAMAWLSGDDTIGVMAQFLDLISDRLDADDWDGIRDDLFADLGAFRPDDPEADPDEGAAYLRSVRHAETCERNAR